MGKTTADIASLRKNYTLASFDENDALGNPIEQFGKWFDQAMECGLDEPNAMSISTVSKEGKPSSRMVLLKGFDGNGFVFFTNYNSRKAQNIHDNPYACILFFWAGLQRQVRIEGSIEKVSDHESDIYFLSRPEGSRIGAWASPQSSIIPSRQWLEEQYMNFDRKEYIETRPDHWGGFRLIPHQFEFWQGRENRLHDRICYLKEKENWIIKRLAP